MRSAFMRVTEEVRNDNNTWLWMEKGYLKKESEGLIMIAKDKPLLTGHVKHYIDRRTDSPKCKLFRKMDENVSHVVSECNAPNEYKKLRHDKVAALLHWQWCKTYGFETHEKHYEHFVENDVRVL